MQKSLRLVGAAALIGLGVWGWFILFPSPEKVIRSRLNRLAGTVSFEPKDGIIARGYRAEKAAGYFTADVEVSVNVRGIEPMVFSGREEIQQRALGAARLLRGLKVEFLDINVTLGPDKQTATANLTAKWTIPGDREFNVQEFNFQLKKVDGEWLIYRVETVKTLSQLILRAA
jgi:hypothetical protein